MLRDPSKKCSGDHMQCKRLNRGESDVRQTTLTSVYISGFFYVIILSDSFISKCRLYGILKNCLNLLRNDIHINWWHSLLKGRQEPNIALFFLNLSFTFEVLEPEAKALQKFSKFCIKHIEMKSVLSKNSFSHFSMNLFLRNFVLRRVRKK